MLRILFARIADIVAQFLAYILRFNVAQYGSIEAHVAQLFQIFKVYPTVMDYAEMADGDTVYSFSPYDDELLLIQNELEELRKIKDKATIEVEALFENQKVR
jgi:hypothetical protein